MIPFSKELTERLRKNHPDVDAETLEELDALRSQLAAIDGARFPELRSDVAARIEEILLTLPHFDEAVVIAEQRSNSVNTAAPWQEELPAETSA